MIDLHRDLVRQQGHQLRGNWAALGTAFDHRGEALTTRLGHLRLALSALGSALAERRSSFAEHRAAEIAHSRNEPIF